MRVLLLIHPGIPWESPLLSYPSVSSLASTLAHSMGHRERSQSPVDMLEHRDTYGQAQVCSKGRQGSSVDRLCQLSCCKQVLTCTESATSEYHSTASEYFCPLQGRQERVNWVVDGNFFLMMIVFIK